MIPSRPATKKPSCPISRALGSASAGKWPRIRGFNGWDGALFHIDEVMGWESVRNLRQMHRSLILVRNILQQADVPDGVAGCLEAVSELMDETLEALSNGEIG